MEVTRSAYYGYLKHKLVGNKPLEVRRAQAVKECFEFHRRRYGSRRLARELKMGRFLVRRLMREQQFAGNSAKKFCAEND
jgi:hypothetical protein